MQKRIDPAKCEYTLLRTSAGQHESPQVPVATGLLTAHGADANDIEYQHGVSV